MGSKLQQKINNIVSFFILSLLISILIVLGIFPLLINFLELTLQAAHTP
tara:strand:- start:8 stop:154 length:147 start_codon:yes stop_codon:yes gene_type:complete